MTENGSRKGHGVLHRDAKGFLLIIVRGYQKQNPNSFNQKHCFQGIIFSIGGSIFQIRCGKLHPIGIYLIAMPNLTLPSLSKMLITLQLLLRKTQCLLQNL